MGLTRHDDQRRRRSVCCRGNGSTTVAGVSVRSWRREKVILREASFVLLVCLSSQEIARATQRKKEQVDMVYVCSTFIASGMLCFSPLHPGLPFLRFIPAFLRTRVCRFLPMMMDAMYISVRVNFVFNELFPFPCPCVLFPLFSHSVIPTCFLREQKRPCPSRLLAVI